VSIVWQCLAYSNSCVNPVIYNHTSKDFRDAFRGTFSSRRRLDTTDCAARDAGGTGTSTRGAGPPQRSARTVTAADRHHGITRVNLEQQQQQQNCVDEIDNLSVCSNRVHLED